MRSRRPWPATSRCRTERDAERRGRRRGVRCQGRPSQTRRGQLSATPDVDVVAPVRRIAFSAVPRRAAPRRAACVSPHCQRSRFFLPTTNLPLLRSPPPRPFPRSHYLFLSLLLCLSLSSALFRYFPITGLRPFVLLLIFLSLSFSRCFFLSNDLILNFLYYCVIRWISFCMIVIV